MNDIRLDIEQGNVRRALSTARLTGHDADRDAIKRVAEASASKGLYYKAAEAYVAIRDVHAAGQLALQCLDRNEVTVAADICAMTMSEAEFAASLYADRTVSVATLRRRVRTTIRNVLIGRSRFA